MASGCCGKKILEGGYFGRVFEKGLLFLGISLAEELLEESCSRT
jgi:hypothetical protein